MIGILYESHEWSDFKLKDELEAVLNESVAMIDMEDDDCLERAFACELLVSRVFASAAFRGHTRAAANMLTLVERLENSAGTSSIKATNATPNYPTLINPAPAHYFEISKYASTQAIIKAGIDAPKILALGQPSKLHEQFNDWEYPCIIKPDCGGRTTHTAVLKTREDASTFLQNAPHLSFIVENFLETRAGFMTRVELVDSEIVLVVKRSVAANGLSSYHEGSRYELYPNYPQRVRDNVIKAAHLLNIRFGSFDVIEAADGAAYIIDANSVSNVSEDCTEIFQLDLMKEYAQALAKIVHTTRRK